MIFDLADLSPNQRYHTMTQTLIPRPVAWILTENEGGDFNLAPFSYFAGVSSEPPLLMVSIGKKPDGSIKDTRKNIIERGHFVVHIAARSQAEIVTETSRSLGYGESELSAQTLATEPFGDFALPRVSDCPVAFACTRYRVEDITQDQAMILGEIQSIYVDDRAVSGEPGRAKIDAQTLDPLARLGGNLYGLLGDVIDVPRPK